MATFAIRNLSFSYGHEEALHDINLNIEAGEFVCLLGESGCGKSTFLRLLAGLEMPTSGSILFEDKAVTRAGLDRGVVFQEYSLFPWLSAGSNLLLSLRQKFRDTPKSVLKQKVMEGLRKVGLGEDVYGKYPFELSGGMRQRCAICRAFMLDPPALLMDEPFGALDAVTRSRLQRMVLNLWQNVGTSHKTLVFVTHDIDEALLLATRIVVFGAKPGRIIYEHLFAPGDKPEDPDKIFADQKILGLRNHLIGILNDDICQR